MVPYARHAPHPVIGRRTQQPSQPERTSKPLRMPQRFLWNIAVVGIVKVEQTFHQSASNSKVYRTTAAAAGCAVHGKGRTCCLYSSLLQLQYARNLNEVCLSLGSKTIRTFSTTALRHFSRIPWLPVGQRMTCRSSQLDHTTKYQLRPSKCRGLEHQFPLCCEYCAALCEYRAACTGGRALGS